MSHRLSVTVALSALAATQANAEAPARPVLDEIIVTADRPDSFSADLVQVGTFRNARLIDVPLTVNVVPDALIKAQAVTGLYEALRNTAGVTRSQLNGATYDNVAIRGILVENRTSYRLNGSLPTVNLVDLPLENKERVEVLKGVGALYYGFAPPSGIVNLVSKRATRDVTRFEASLNSSAGTRMSADIGRRWGSFGLRFNGSVGLVDTGISKFNGTRVVAAMAGDWDVAPGLTTRLDVEYVTKNVTEPSAIVVAANAAGVLTLPPVPDNRVNLGDKSLRYDASATNVLARVDWKITDAVALTIEGGQALTVRDRDFSQLGSINLTSGEGVLQLFRTRDQRYRNRNIRAELAAAFATGPVTHNLIAGATSNWRYQNGRSSATTPATAVAGAIVQNLFAPRQLTIAPFAATLTTAPLDVRDRGVYVLDRAVFGPVQFLAGVRYSDYRSIATSATGVVTRIAIDRWTPSVGLIIKPAQNLSVYATYLEGLEEGGFAPATAVNANEVLPPAVSRQYEVGVKSEFGRGLIVQVAGFQVDRPSAFTDPSDNRFKLAGQARYRGIEASLTGEVTRDLSIYASAQYLDAGTLRALNPLAANKRPENTPEWTASIYGEHRFGRLALGGGMFYIGNRAVNGLNQAFIPGYALFNGSLRYRFTGAAKNVELQANVENIADKSYYSATGANLLGGGLPRQAKLTVRVAL